MVKILHLREANDQYAQYKFSVELDREDLAKLDGIEINFCSLSERNGKKWVRMLSLKEKDGPNEGEYVSATSLKGFDLGVVREKLKEAIEGAANSHSDDCSDDLDMPF